jgi:hypothetical protein
MDEKILEIVIDSVDTCTDNDGKVIFSSSYIYINGELVDSDGNHIEAVLRHLGYDAKVYYE